MNARELKRLLPRGADDGMATHILHACATTRFPLSYALATVEKESGFRNVFGHDPTSSIPRSWMGKRVTRAKYLVYKANRRRGKGMQGVGPTQLTWYEFQDQADKIGGCHKPYPNMVVGFRLMKNLIAQHGKQGGAQRFNGAGAAAEQYGRDWVRVQQRWHDRLT